MVKANHWTDKLRILGIISVLFGTGIACDGRPTSPTPTDAVTMNSISTLSSTPTVGATTAVTISPMEIPAALNEPVRPEGRYVINPSVTFSAAGTNATAVKEVRFSFVVDTDRVIKHGAFLVHGGDLRRGPVTQRYPLTFDIPVHFRDLRVRMTAIFIDGSGADMLTPHAEASVELPSGRP